MFLLALDTIWLPDTALLTNACQKEKKRKDYAFRRQFNEKPSIIPGCPGPMHATISG